MPKSQTIGVRVPADLLAAAYAGLGRDVPPATLARIGLARLAGLPDDVAELPMGRPMLGVRDDHDHDGDTA